MTLFEMAAHLASAYRQGKKASTINDCRCQAGKALAGLEVKVPQFPSDQAPHLYRLKDKKPIPTTVLKIDPKKIAEDDEYCDFMLMHLTFLELSNDCKMVLECLRAARDWQERVVDFNEENDQVAERAFKALRHFGKWDPQSKFEISKKNSELGKKSKGVPKNKLLSRIKEVMAEHKKRGVKFNDFIDAWLKSPEDCLQLKAIEGGSENFQVIDTDSADPEPKKYKRSTLEGYYSNCKMQ